MPHHRNLCTDERLDHRNPRKAAFQLHCLCPCPYETGGIADGVEHTQVIAHPGHVSDDHAGDLCTGHCSNVAFHIVDRDLQGVLVAEHVVRDGIANEHYVDSGLVDDASAWLVIGGDHHDRRSTVTAFASGERRNRDRFGGHDRPNAAERRIVPPPGYFRMRWCQAHSTQTSTS